MIAIDTHLLGMLVVLAALAGVLLLLARRHQQDAKQQESAQQRLRQRDQAQAEFAVVTDQAMRDLKLSVEGLATCLANMELRLRTLDQRQRKLDEQSAQLIRRRGFDEALNLVRDGRPKMEIARHCALPLAEVELLQRIHGQSAQH